MTRRQKSVLTFLIVAAAGLGACGLKGDLKTPPPIWGDSQQSEPQDASMPPPPTPDRPLPYTR